MLSVETALVAAVSSLAGVVLVLWNWFTRAHNRITHRLDECEKEKKQLWDAILGLRSSSCPIVGCPLRGRVPMIPILPVLPVDPPRKKPKSK